MNSKATIIVSGMIASDPGQGGATWAVLQYVLGLQQLGYKTFLIETIQPNSIQPVESSLAKSANARYFERVTSEFGIADRAALLLAGSKQTFGLSYDHLRQVAEQADVLINISGLLTDETLMAAIPVRVYLDLDPAFNQLWHAVQGIDMRFDGHTHFVTIGQAIGTAHCPIPTCGLNWLKTLQPVVLEYWPVTSDIRYDALTSIGNWRAYGSIDYQGVQYGQKAHSLRKFVSLPLMTSERFALALAIHPNETKDLETLNRNNWQLIDPSVTVNTPEQYQEFIQQSKGEFGIAKSGYVASQCGWFSDRSLCYLASGRPVIAQETGFSGYLPTGEGLFSFDNPDDVCCAIEKLNEDYPRHARKARLIAEEYFDSGRVLKCLLKKVGID